MQYNIVSINRELLKLCRTSRFETYMCAYIYIVTKLNSITRIKRSSSRGSIFNPFETQETRRIRIFSGSKIEKSTIIPKDLSLKWVLHGDWRYKRKCYSLQYIFIQR